MTRPEPQYATLLLERPADGVVVLTMNRPASANAVVPESAADLMSALNQVDADLSIRCAVLTGAGRHFCAGADLEGFRAHLATELSVTEEPFNARLLMPVTQRIAGLRVPVIAAVNGAATAGGFDLALACDLRIGSTTSRVGETYINLGLAPGNGGAYFLPRLVGSGKAAELALTGAMIDAGEALRLGIFNRVVEPDALVAAAVELATEIAAKPRRAVEATKHLLRTSWHTDLAGSLATSYWITSSLQQGRDVREGVDAAVEKRTPHYNTPTDDPDAG